MLHSGETEEQFRLLFEAAPNGMIVTDHDGVITFVNSRVEKLFGYWRGELIGRSVEVLVPERFQGAHPSLRAQFAKQPETRAMGAGRDLYGLRKNKTEFPVEIGLNPFRSGGRLLIVASVIDITERKRNEEHIRFITERKRNEDHIRFIMDDLPHRSKNLLMVVLAIASQTVQRATSFGEFQKDFESRLMAIARSHDVLVEKGWSGASIEALIFAQLKPFIGESATRLDVAGPPIMLVPEAAQNIGLALHELATNATKYGALSSPEGCIVIRWDVDDRQTPKKFRLSWHEQGGPPVNPPTHQGFGHRVLSHIAQGSSDTGVGLMFAPEGFAWSFECEEQLMLRH
jgi:PAS domain S-box-containing protein